MNFTSGEKKSIILDSSDMFYEQVVNLKGSINIASSLLAQQRKQQSKQWNCSRLEFLSQ